MIIHQWNAETAAAFAASPMAGWAIQGMPAEDYFDFPGVNHSTLKRFDPPATPAHVRAYLDGESEEPSDEMILGTLTHQRILEPMATPPALAVKPAAMKFSTTEGKLWRSDQRAAARLIVTEERWTALQVMTRRVAEHSTCRLIFDEGLSEVSIFVPLEVDGDPVLCKARNDWVPYGVNYLVDIKTCQDASNSGFQKATMDFSYHSQAEWYLRLWNELTPDDPRELMLFVALEKTPPYMLKIWQMSQRAIDKGAELNDRRLSTYAACVRSGVWPGYSDAVEVLELPERKVWRD